MTFEKCPNCGAQVAPSAVKCEYCGSVVSDAPDMSWCRVDRQLPPADPEHPGRSIYVITLKLADGVIWTNKKGQSFNMYQDRFDLAFINEKTRGGMPYFLISAYYDFITKKWTNELLGPRHEEIHPTHWMAIPSKSSSAWIAATDHLPPVEPSIGATINVLVCDQAGNFPASVTVGHAIPSPYLMWMCYGLTNPTRGNVHNYDISVTHWMPYPPIGPRE